MKSFLFFWLLFLLPVAAHAIDCPAPTMPRVTLNRIEDPVQYDFTLNRAALNQKGAGILNANAASVVGSSAYVGGLTNGTIASNMSTQLQTLTAPDGTACIWVSDINIQLHYEPVVYISREFQTGSCYHNAVMEHEQKHVAVDHALLAMFAPELQQAVAVAAQTQGRRGPIAARQLAENSRELQNMMEKKLNDMMDNLSTVREARQRQIDTPQEYARVQALCQNWP